MANQILKNQVAIVTGGLGGLGRAVAMKLWQAGAVLVLIDRDQEVPIELKSFLKNQRVHFFPASVAEPDKIHSLMKKVFNKFKRIDILVNCAGVLGPVGKLHTNDLKSWQNAVKVNLLGTINTCHAVLPFMVRQKRGKIVNFAGGGAVEPFPNFSAYACSKAGVVRFTENLAWEYESFNIEVNAVSPGRIYTKLVENLLSAGKDKVGREYFDRVLKSKKKGGDDPAQATELVLFLSAPKNKLTGKLVSAHWDPWRKLSPSAIKKLNKTSEYTLRRIDNKYFYAK
jgi:NAD(P)-dependent dehydrogenase (short-subunit alcohol dehydrogenase family)